MTDDPLQFPEHVISHSIRLRSSKVSFGRWTVDMFSHCGRLSTLVPVNSTSLNEEAQTIPELNCIFFCSRLSPCPFIALSFSIGLASCSASKFDFSLPMLWQLDVNARDCGALLGDGPNFLLCRSSSSDYFFIYFYLNGSPLLLLHLMTPDRSVDLLCCSRSSCLSVKIFPPKKKAGAVSHSLGRH